MSIRRIDLLEKPESDEYSVAANFTLQLHQAMIKKGIDCHLIKEGEYFKSPVEDPPDITMQFNDCPRDSEGRLLCQLTGVPHVALLIDPPFRVMKLAKEKNIILTCDDAYWNQVLDEMGYRNHFFLPHAAGKDLLCDQAEKKYDVAMLATCIDYEAASRVIRFTLPQPQRIAMNFVIMKTLSDSSTSFAKALFDAFQRLLPKKKLSQVKFDYLLLILELYIKGKDRTELARSIKDAEVHVFGKGLPITQWSNFLGDRPNVVLHDGVAFTDALEVMRRSRVLLNSSIKNKMGAHERIFLGLLSGALVVTHENPYLKEYFQDEESILFYRHSELHKLNNKVMKYLSNEEKRREIVEKGRAVVLKHHTWDNRVDTLLEKLPPILNRIAAG